MKARLIILIAVAGGLAVYFAVAGRKPVEQAVANNGSTAGDDRNLNPQQRKELITELGKMDLPGEEPPDPPHISATVEVDTSTGKNRLNISLSEDHGYYVEGIRMRLWYKETPETDYDESPLRLEHFIDRYIKANETLQTCLEVVPAELAEVGGDIGTTANWGIEVASHGRARAQNPTHLPYRPDDGRCSG